MKHCILIATAFFLFACSNDNPAPVDNTVHLAGFLAPNGSAEASYWKDGVATELAPEVMSSNVTSLYVDGSSVFIGGWIFVENEGSSLVFWEDSQQNLIEAGFGSPALIASQNNDMVGVWFEIPTGWVLNRNGATQPIIDTASNIGPTGLAMLGEDAYVSGASASHDDTSPDARWYQHAQCWRNGQLIFRDTELSNAMGIFIHQNDIYMAGYYEDASSNSKACYWKNEQRINLPGEGAIAFSMFVTETNVYVSGVVNNQAVYWKDGEMVVLTTPGSYSAANSIFVQGTDVHIGGVEHGHPAYWKNDVKQAIANQDTPGAIKFVVVGSN